jgi:hypothetical protein
MFLVLERETRAFHLRGSMRNSISFPQRGIGQNRVFIMAASRSRAKSAAISSFGASAVIPSSWVKDQ